MSLDIVREAFATLPIKDGRSELELVPGSLKDVGGAVWGSVQLLLFDQNGITDIKEQELQLVPLLAQAESFPRVLEAAGAALRQLNDDDRARVLPEHLFPLRAWGHADVASAVASIGSSLHEIRTRTATAKADAMFEGLEPLAQAHRDRVIQSWFREDEPEWKNDQALREHPGFIDYVERFLVRSAWKDLEDTSWLFGLRKALHIAPRQPVLRMFARLAPIHHGWIVGTLDAWPEAWPDARTELAALAASEPESAEGVRVLIEQLDALEALME